MRAVGIIALRSGFLRNGDARPAAAGTFHASGASPDMTRRTGEMTKSAFSSTPASIPCMRRTSR